MGAMLRFKRETGKEVTEIDGSSLSELCAYLYCCVASASAADRIAFEYSLQEFADAISPDDMTAWANAMQATAGNTEGEKKRPRRKE